MSVQVPAVPAGEAAGAAPTVTVCKALYHVSAVSDPGALARILQPFAKLGLMPQRVHASSEDGDGSEQSVDVRVSGLAQREARIVEKSLRGTIGVRHVVMVIEAL